MKNLTAQPHPLLVENILHYWAIEIEAGDNSLHQKIFPGTHLDLIFHIGGPALYSSNGTSWTTRKPVAFIEGHFETAFHLHFQPGTKIFGIAFKPLGIFPFVACDINEFSNNFTDLPLIFGNECKGLIDRVQESGNFETSVEWFDQFLISQFKPKYRPKSHVSEAMKLLTQNSGVVKVSNLSKQVFVSERKLQRDFKFFAGMSVERMSKLIRFRKAIQLIKNPEMQTLKEVSQKLDYYDQSHFIRDIRKNTGLSVSNLISPATEISQLLMADELM